ncbi:replication protein A 70 kDa DNA-binding subunit E-like [Chenopodium quinoa]|uniref:replication protein A 70 kDa DNA-binding subunit E-like n=1 Tax=Chenopodium quinoa TaxID=63459 RepID=UPI000B794D7A|nr:replication protein A 70 kDa DNA-binding subunit E-like [Chenopodium quinoa]
MAGSNLIRQLNSSKNDWKIKVRVSRLFDVLNFRKQDSLISLDMVLLDEEGDYIHASIKSNFVQPFRPKLIEGKVYTIRYFSVVPNKNQYRICCIFMLDVVGMVVNEIGDSIEIEDKWGKRAQIKLWNKVFTEYTKQKNQLNDFTKPFPIIITSTMVKEFNGNFNLTSSSSTKIYTNVEVPEVQFLKDICEKTENSTIGKLEIQCTSTDSQEIISKKIDISTLMNHIQKTVENDLIFYCKAKVTDIMGENGWYYISCPVCKRRVTPRLADFLCILCEKSIERPIPRYRLELGVEDHSGSTIFVIFDEEAKKLIGQDGSTVFEAHIYEKANNKDDASDNDAESEIPMIIKNIIGKELIFKVKITAYNRKTLRQTFTVMKIFETIILEDDKEATTNKDEDTSKDDGKRTHNESDSKDDKDSSNNTFKKSKA